MWMQFLALAPVLTGLVLLLCKWSATTKYCVKFTMYYAFISVSSVVVILLSLAAPRDPKNFRYMRFFFAVCRYMVGIHPEVRGRKNLKSEQPFVIVSNHQSSLDFLCVGAAMPPRCTFLSKKEIMMYYGPFGIAGWFCGAIFIDRLNHDSAIKTMVKAARTIKEKNYVVWIFPEGKRNSGKKMLPFKTGAFHLAVQAQVPVVPVVFSAYHFYDKRKKRLDTGTVIVTALPPVSTVGLTANDVPSLTENVRQRMMKVFQETSAE